MEVECASTGREIQNSTFRIPNPISALFSYANKTIIAAASALNPETFQQIHAPSHIWPMTVTADFILTGHADAAIRIYSLSNKTLIRNLTGHSDVVQALDTCGDFLISGGRDGRVIVWNLTSWLPIQTLHFPGAVSDVKLKNGVLVVSSLKNAYIYGRVPALNMFVFFHELSGHSEAVNAVDFDTEKVVTAGNDNNLMVRFGTVEGNEG